jgi:hypothetical protein
MIGEVSCLLFGCDVTISDDGIEQLPNVKLWGVLLNAASAKHQLIGRSGNT